MHGRYELLERLGEGESAIVHRARDLAQGGREVALKQLKSTGEREVTRFQREFELLAALRHPNLVPVLDFGVSEEGPYYTAEFHPGQRTLRDALRQGDGPSGLVERIERVVAILRALEYVHTRGHVHRDVKPENVLIDGQGEVRLADFGLAGVAEGTVAGTPQYIAPEVLRRLRIDRRADLYSLGVLLYEVCCGQVPYDDPDPAEVARKHLEDRPRPPRELRPDLPEALEHTILRLLEKEPADRFPSANAVIAALAEAVGHELPFETSATKEAYLLSGRFVGRDRELDWLAEAFQRALDPGGWNADPREFDRRARFHTSRVVRVGERRRGGNRRASSADPTQNPPALLVLVRGESGVGKTRLVQELRRRAQLAGATFLQGECRKHQARVYEPFVPILKEAAQLAEGEGRGGEADDPISRAVSQVLSQAVEAQEARGSERLQLIDALAEFLVAQATRRPLVLALECLHWARGETLELLTHLHRTLVTILSGAKSAERRPQLFVVATYRPEELHGPELGRVLRDLRRDRFFEELTLRPLKADDTSELIRSMLGVPGVPRGFVERVQAESGGSPLFVELLMEELVERGIVDRARGLWRLDPERLQGLEVPRRVHDLVLSRLSRLPHRELLDWLAVLDRAASPALLATLSGQPEEVVARGLDELVRERVLTPAGREGYELAHSRVRDVIYEASGDRADRHRRVAAALEEALALGDTAASAVELAHHLLEAGQGFLALRGARRAGEALVALGARERACELWTRALRVADDHLGLIPPGPAEDPGRSALREEKLLLLRALVQEAQPLGRLAEARTHTLEALELARQLGDPQAEVAALTQLGGLNAKLKESDDAKRCFFEALKTSERIGYGRGAGSSLLGLGDLTLEEGRLEEALVYLERSLRFEKDLGDGREIAGYLRAIGQAYKKKGDLARALEHVERALEQDRAAGDRKSEMASLELLADLCFLRGDYARSLEAGDRAIALAERSDGRSTPDEAAVSRCLLAIAAAQERLGQRAEARRRWQEAQALARRLGLESVLAQALNGLGLLHAQAAEWDDALAAFNEATTLWNTQGDKQGYALGLINLGLGYARRGELSRAGSCYDAASRIGWEVSFREAQLEAALGRAHVHRLTGDVARAKELLDKTALRAREQRATRIEALCLAELARFIAAEGEGARALRAAQRARALARELTDEAASARVTLCTAEADLLRGALTPALQAARTREDWLRGARDQLLVIEAEAFTARALLAAGDLDGAARALEDARAEASARRAGPLGLELRLDEAELLLGRATSEQAWRPGHVLVASAEVGRARALLQAARGEADQAGARTPGRRAALLLARADLLEGQLPRAEEQARAVLEEALAAEDLPSRRAARALLATALAIRDPGEDALLQLDELDPLLPAERVERAAVRALLCERLGRRLEAKSSLEDGQQALEELALGLEPQDRERLLAAAPAQGLRAAREQTGEAPLEGEAAPRRRDRGALFLRAARELHAREDAPAQMRALVDLALQLTGAQRGLLLEVGKNGEQTVREARLAPGRELPEAERRTSSTLVTQVAQTGEPLLLPDARGDQLHGERPSVVELQVRSLIAAPVPAGRHERGRWVLVLEDRASAGRFLAEDRELLAELCTLAGAALEASRLREQAAVQARELAQRTEEIQRLDAALSAELHERREELDAVKAALKGREYELGVRSTFANIVGASPPMQRVFQLLEKVADSDVPVLVQGESGTGKELVARAVHFNSTRKQRPFLSINCAALPESLLEAELFGHVKGAFTGADRDKIGLFEAADGGTLFLDEVGDMPTSMQTKLLRALQEGEVRPLGSRTPRKVQVRVVSASNKDLRRLVEEGQFRADLFYRLNVVSVHLPPLRERKDDLPLLVDHLLDKIAARADGKRKGVERKVIDHLLHYDWPGNIRELENELRRLVALSGARITERDLSPHIRQSVQAAQQAAAPAQPDLLSLSDSETLKDRIEDFERRLLIAALRDNEHNKTRTAKLLGLSRYGFLKKLDKYGLRDKDDDGDPIPEGGARDEDEAS